MVIAIGADHGGYKYKELIKEEFKELVTIIDVGATTLDPKDDYTTFSFKVGEEVASGKADYGIMICRTGVGAVIALNKIKGIRAGVLETEEGVLLARKKNNINVLSFGADNITSLEALKITKLFLTTKFDGGRHKKRLQDIADYEEKHIK